MGKRFDSTGNGQPSAEFPSPGPRPRPTSIPELLTVEEVAATLRLSRSKIYELIASRCLLALRPGGRIRVPADSVKEYLRLSRV